MNYLNIQDTLLIFLESQLVMEWEMERYLFAKGLNNGNVEAVPYMGLKLSLARSKGRKHSFF